MGRPEPNRKIPALKLCQHPSQFITESPVSPIGPWVGPGFSGFARGPGRKLDGPSRAGPVAKPLGRATPPELGFVQFCVDVSGFCHVLFIRNYILNHFLKLFRQSVFLAPLAGHLSYGFCRKPVIVSCIDYVLSGPFHVVVVITVF